MSFDVSSALKSFDLKLISSARSLWQQALIIFFGVPIDRGSILSDYCSREKYDTATDQKRIMDAIMLVAQTEGILLDPIYTGKAMAALIDMAKQKRFDKEDNVVFIHTGGTPALSVHSRASPFPLPYSFVRLYSKYTFLRRFRDILPL